MSTKAELNEAQLDGLACCLCGAEAPVMVPAGWQDGGQVFRCSTCPPAALEEPANRKAPEKVQSSSGIGRGRYIVNLASGMNLGGIKN